MAELDNEPATSPIIRIGVAVVFLCFAALAICYAWIHYERTGTGKDLPAESVIDTNGNSSSDPNPPTIR